MNKRMIVVLFCLVMSISFNSAVAMHGRILTGVKCVTGGSLIAVGSCAAYITNEQRKKPIQGVPMPPRVQAWARQELSALNVANAEEIPLLIAEEEGSWRIEKDRVIRCSLDDSLLLLRSLYDDSKSEKSRRGIARSTIVLKHEVKHLVDQDGKRKMCSLVVIPMAIQAGCSVLTLNFNKVFNIKPPKAALYTMLRSSFAIAMIAPKAVMNFVGIATYARYQETEADRFACQNATHRVELEEYYNVYKERHDEMKAALSTQKEFFQLEPAAKNIAMRVINFRYEPFRPYDLDRAAIAQDYLQKWDEEALFQEYVQKWTEEYKS